MLAFTANLAALKALCAAIVFAGVWSTSAQAAAWRVIDPENLIVIDTTRGRIVVEVSPLFAPLAVARVKQLARQHFYDGLLFHRVVDGYVDQTGNPNNRDGGKSTYPNLLPEFRLSLPASAIDAIVTKSSDGISGFAGGVAFQASPDPTKPGQWRAWPAYCAGVAGMGRDTDPGSANSEIFFMRAPSRSLDHDYAVWGHVVAGLDIVQHMAVGYPPPKPDRMLQVRLAADLPPQDRPDLEKLDIASQEFRTAIASARQRLGADFSICDVTVAVRRRND